MLPFMGRRRTCTCTCGASFSVHAEQCPVCGANNVEVMRLGRGDRLATYVSAAAFIIGILGGLFAIAANAPSIMKAIRTLFGWT
jgi:hypothetical protein